MIIVLVDMAECHIPIYIQFVLTRYQPPGRIRVERPTQLTIQEEEEEEEEEEFSAPVIYSYSK